MSHSFPKQRGYKHTVMVISPRNHIWDIASRIMKEATWLSQFEECWEKTSAKSFMEEHPRRLPPLKCLKGKAKHIRENSTWIRVQQTLWDKWCTECPVTIRLAPSQVWSGQIGPPKEKGEGSMTRIEQSCLGSKTKSYIGSCGRKLASFP